jgi:hypothetical protein
MGRMLSHKNARVNHFFVIQEFVRGAHHVVTECTLAFTPMTGAYRKRIK